MRQKSLLHTVTHEPSVADARTFYEKLLAATARRSGEARRTESR